MSHNADMGTGSAVERTRGNRWMAIRTRIIGRDGGLCVVCRARGHIQPAHEVDHIIPLVDGGTDDADNLQAICHECHAIKTARESGHKPRVRIGVDGWPASGGGG